MLPMDLSCTSIRGMYFPCGRDKVSQRNACVCTTYERCRAGSSEGCNGILKLLLDDTGDGALARHRFVMLRGWFNFSRRCSWDLVYGSALGSYRLVPSLFIEQLVGDVLFGSSPKLIVVIIVIRTPCSTVSVGPGMVSRMLSLALDRPPSLTRL